MNFYTNSCEEILYNRNDADLKNTTSPVLNFFNQNIITPNVKLLFCPVSNSIIVHSLFLTSSNSCKVDVIIKKLGKFYYVLKSGQLIKNSTLSFDKPINLIETDELFINVPCGYLLPLAESTSTVNEAKSYYDTGDGSVNNPKIRCAVIGTSVYAVASIMQVSTDAIY